MRRIMIALLAGIGALAGGIELSAAKVQKYAFYRTGAERHAKITELEEGILRSMEESGLTPLKHQAISILANLPGNRELFNCVTVQCLGSISKMLGADFILAEHRGEKEFVLILFEQKRNRRLEAVFPDGRLAEMNPTSEAVALFERWFPRTRKLEPIRLATLEIVSNVDRATIEINGTRFENWRLNEPIKNIPPGQVEVRLISADVDGGSLTRSIEFVSGRTATIEFYVEPPVAKVAKPAPVAKVAAPSSVKAAKPSTSIFKKWWFWTAVSAVVAGGVAATSIAVLNQEVGGSPPPTPVPGPIVFGSSAQ